MILRFRNGCKNSGKIWWMMKFHYREAQETTIVGNPFDDSEIPEWLQEFRENLVDDEIPLQGGSHASSSHEASLEPSTKRREDLDKHSVYTHFPKTEIVKSASEPK